MGNQRWQGARHTRTNIKMGETRPKPKTEIGICIIKRKTPTCCDDENCTFLEEHSCLYEKYCKEDCPILREQIFFEAKSQNISLKEQIRSLKARLEAAEDACVRLDSAMC
ncbi:hypothetical protein FOCC_FOCC002539 [Frankliniella occidentalis]|uniref:Uncharacterized protein LOC113213727 n=1 Tax=Frankliniella occidentalis TaxID=133901 RepID=A0A6J1T5Z3_FRAOC|nr:uncharacterized protein LOC113213727 [Frankliniella occidentalis]XP_026291767.2 uncharacterized protein LOC113216243 [Frankliniella occidentalis]KAE8749241.1 hypothetical protein FOCC_FOCC003948 [Frankliniella occidentalis]KAE8750828.1 hypothetical protein FOCC_FOCC002539 [Frankliniella occidentalis]